MLEAARQLAMQLGRPGDAVKAISAMAALYGLDRPRSVPTVHVERPETRLGDREIARRLIFLLEKGKREPEKWGDDHIDRRM